MVLIFGWVGLLLLVIAAFKVSGLSPFHASIPPGALQWDQGMSLWGFLLLSAPFALGALAIWLVPWTGYAPLAGRSLVAAGAVSFVLGLLWISRTGHAIYPDRILHRDSSFAELRTERFEDIARVEVACVLVRPRRSSTKHPSPLYRLVFKSGYSVDVWERGGFTWGRPETPIIDIVRRVDRAARQAGAVRAPARKPDGSLIGDAGCLTRLAADQGFDLDELQRLFEVEMSELRFGEYVLAPEA